MRLTGFGIASCDRCREARRWLSENKIDHNWTDLRQSPPDAQVLRQWLEHLGLEALVNRRSTTWRRLPESERLAPDDPGWATLLHHHPTLIRRPLWVRDDGELRCGFDDATRVWLSATG